MTRGSALTYVLTYLIIYYSLTLAIGIGDWWALGLGIFGGMWASFRYERRERGD